MSSAKVTLRMPEPAPCFLSHRLSQTVIDGHRSLGIFFFFFSFSFSFLSFFLQSLSFERWWGGGGGGAEVGGNLDVEKNMTVTGRNCMPIYPRSSIKKSTTRNHKCVALIQFSCILYSGKRARLGQVFEHDDAPVSMFPERQRQPSLSGTNL